MNDRDRVDWESLRINIQDTLSVTLLVLATFLMGQGITAKDSTAIIFGSIGLAYGLFSIRFHDLIYFYILWCQLEWLKRKIRKDENKIQVI